MSSARSERKPSHQRLLTTFRVAPGRGGEVGDLAGSVVCHSLDAASPSSHLVLRDGLDALPAKRRGLVPSRGGLVARWGADTPTGLRLAVARGAPSGEVGG
jgi:hypothetical protein